MEEAIDVLIEAFSPCSCLAIPRRADQSLLLTITDRRRLATVTRVIPFRELQCKTALAFVIRDLQRDLAHAIGAIDNKCLIDLRIGGARIRRFDT